MLRYEAPNIQSCRDGSSGIGFNPLCGLLPDATCISPLRSPPPRPPPTHKHTRTHTSGKYHQGFHTQFSSLSLTHRHMLSLTHSHSHSLTFSPIHTHRTYTHMNTCTSGEYSPSSRYNIFFPPPPPPPPPHTTPPKGQAKKARGGGGGGGADAPKHADQKIKRND